MAEYGLITKGLPVGCAEPGHEVGWHFGQGGFVVEIHAAVAVQGAHAGEHIGGKAQAFGFVIGAVGIGRVAIHMGEKPIGAALQGGGHFGGAALCFFGRPLRPNAGVHDQVVAVLQHQGLVPQPIEQHLAVGGGKNVAHSIAALEFAVAVGDG